MKINYKMLFFIGIVWFAIGIPFKNELLMMMGGAFILIGFLNKNKWNKK